MHEGEAQPPTSERCEQRLDKWLWFARVAKTRTLAARLVAEGKIRLNRVRTAKASQAVKAGDVITASVGRQVRVLKVVGMATRRGPPHEAALLFEELTAAKDATMSAAPASPQGQGLRPQGSGRPTKRDRREIGRLKGKPG